MDEKEKDYQERTQRLKNNIGVIRDAVNMGGPEIVADLKAIKDSKHYLNYYKNFSDYCKKELGFSDTTAYRLIQKYIEEKWLPEGQRQDQKKTESRKSGKVDTKQDSKKDAEPKDEKTSGPEASESSKDEPPDDIIVYFDQEKRQLPERLVPIFETADKDARDILSSISELKALAEMRFKSESWVGMNQTTFIEQYIFNLRALIKFGRPWAYCPLCGGDGGIKKSCTTCKGSGWLTNRQWEMIPKDQRGVKE